MKRIPSTHRASEIPLIEVRGDARQRGRQYGEAAREQIARSIAYYRESYARSAKLSWEQVLELCPRWEPLIEGYLPGILEEVRGLAEGSNRKYEEILALNGRGELTEGNPFLEQQPDDGCSSFALTDEATGDGHVYCGQNWDWRAGVTDTVVALKMEQPGKPVILMHAEAGQVGRQGANSAGIGLNANGLGGRFGRDIGVPSTFIRRRILDAWDMHDALEAVFSARQSFCGNLLLTHRESFAIDVETTPARHGWMYPSNGMLVHTNHFMAFVPPQIESTYRPFSVDSLYRAPRIERVLKHSKEATSPEATRALIAEALRDHFGYPNSVCNHPDQRDEPLKQNQTIASNIVDLTSGEYYLAAGTPCDTDYVKLPWNLYDQAAEPPSHAGGPARSTRNGRTAANGRAVGAARQ